MATQLQMRNRQRGAVLVVALMLLLVTTFIGFSSMETSNLESKMATTRELKELTFQTAESVIEQSLDNIAFIAQAYAVSVQGGTNWPTQEYDFDYDTSLAGTSEVSFVGNDSTEGYTVRKGASGIATYYYEVRSTASRTGTNISSTHIQGVYVEGPSLN